VVLTEAQMPDCELPRVASSPSLGVAELEDGTMALVAIRDIAAGENFSIAPSDSEEEEEEEEEEDEDGEEEEEEEERDPHAMRKARLGIV